MRPTVIFSLIGAVLAGCHEPPPGPIYGFVEVVDWQYANGPRFHDVYARFRQGPRPVADEQEEDCERITVGACEAVRCRGDGSSLFDTERTPRPTRPRPRPLDAGEVEVVIDGARVLVAREGTDYWSELGAPPTAGQEVWVSATGAEVNPFSVRGIAPGRPELDLPSSIAATEGLTLTWEPPPIEVSMRVLVTSSIIVLGGSAHSEIVCEPDAASGAVFIEPGAFEHIDIDDRGLSINARYEATFTTTEGVTEVDLHFWQQVISAYIPTRR